MMLESREDIISIHNHPTSKIPSPQDLYSASKRGQKYGLIIGHDGRVYRYRNTKTITSDMKRLYHIKFDMHYQRRYNNDKEFYKDLYNTLGIELEEI